MAKFALLIGSGNYEHSQDFNALETAARNVAALKTLFEDPEIGDFDEVTVLTHPTESEMRRAIAILFSQERSKKDTLLLYFAGHGVKDDSERLYFAARDSERNLLGATALQASWVHQQMNTCWAKRQIIVLDCCFSGAFDPQLNAMADNSVDLNQLVGRTGAEGRVAFASSRGLEYSFERKDMDLSIYTSFFVEGIKTGAGDLDEDGVIRADELHDLVSQQVRNMELRMKPKIIVLKDQGCGVIISKVQSIKETSLEENQLKGNESSASAIESHSLMTAAIKPVSTMSRRQVLRYGAFGVTGVGAALSISVLANRKPQSFTFVKPKIEEYTELGISDEIPLEMVKIPAGTFWMGSPETEKDRQENESPQHKVVVPDFLMGKYEVTQAQWRVVANWQPIELELDPEPSYFSGNDQLPVEQVSWEQAVEFCKRLSHKTRKFYRLPTEAEWEYACRAVIPLESSDDLTLKIWNKKYLQRFYFGDDYAYDSLGKYAWYADNSGDKALDSIQMMQEGLTWEEHAENLMKSNSRPHPVGTKKTNNFGLYDMHGNVYEWCQDDWNLNYQNALDNSVVNQNQSDIYASKVLRGGSFVHLPMDCRSADRNFDSRQNYSAFTGFRVACPFSINS